MIINPRTAVRDFPASRWYRAAVSRRITMRLAAAAAVLALALPAAATPGFFNVDAPEQKEASIDVAKASSTCSLWARYDPQHVVWQEQHFLGGFTTCGGWNGFYAAATAAAGQLPAWQTFGYGKVSVPTGPPIGDAAYMCSVNVNFEPATPSKVQVVFTGSGSCTAQLDRVLAVLKGSMGCNAIGGMCPWSNP
jgi:hypothetical protein